MIKMRKRGVAILLMMLCTISTILLSASRTQFPFSNLKVENIDYIGVIFGAYPEYPLRENDYATLISDLQQIDVGNERHDYTEYDGVVWQMFILHMKNGSNIAISASSPFFFINDIAYECNSGIMRDISGLYNSYIDIIRADSKPVA